LVIGSGVIGSSIAWRLAQGGARVTLLEAQRYFGQSSWAGAGMLSPHGERFPSEQWRARALESLGLFPGFVEELARESGDAIDFTLCGAVEMIDGVEHRYPDEAIVNPRDLGAALRTLLKEHGVRILQYQPAVEILRDGERWLVDRLSADALVIAAGAWSGQLRLAGQALPATVPVKGYLLGYAMKPGTLPHIRRQGHTYLLQRQDGFTIAGSTEEQIGFDETIDAALVQELHQRACALWPALADRTPTRVWTGLRPATESGQIYVEPFGGDPTCWLAYGHFRNGILLAPWTARHVADGVLKAAPAPAAPMLTAR